MRPGQDDELTLKMYMLCTTTGIWRPRLLAKAWRMSKVTLPAHIHSWPTCPTLSPPLLT